MKKRLLSSFLVLAMVLSMLPTTVFATEKTDVDSAQDGTMSLMEQVELWGQSALSTVSTDDSTSSAVIGTAASNPFYIGNATILAELATLVNAGTDYYGYSYASAYYVMVDDIDLGDMDWTAIGLETTGYRFAGTFDGGGYQITGLNLNNTDKADQGLFGFNTGTIQNLTVSGSVTTTGQDIGGLAGTNTGTIDNCISHVDVTGTSNVGGLVGSLGGNTSVVQNSIATGTITGTGIGAAGVVGLIGTSTGAMIKNCVALNESVTGNTAGRVAGSNNNKSTDISTYLSNNYAWSGMKIGSSGNEATVTDGTTTNTNGADLTYSNGAWTGLTAWLTTYSGWSTDMTALPNGEDLPSYITSDTSSETIEISSQADLANMGLTGNYVLTCDITLTGTWTPIGTAAAKFTGTFDGGGHTISGLNVEGGSTAYQGLFGYVSGGTVKNVHVSGTVSGGNWVGGVVAYNYPGTVENCSFSGSVSGSQHVGGVVGKSETKDSVVASVTNCYNTGTVTGSSTYAGGVVGNNTGTISYCYNTGSVTASNYSYVGGITGNNNATAAAVANCFNTGAVTGSKYVGGIVGQNTSGTVKNCVALCETVTGSEYVGRVIGKNSDAQSDNYAWGSMTRNETVGTTGTDNISGTDLTYNSTSGALTANNIDSWSTIFTTLPDGWVDAMSTLPNGGILPYYITGAAAVTYIYTQADLEGIADDLSGNYILMNDIDLGGSESPWTPIGTYTTSTNNAPFTGTFDGGDYTISGLYISGSKYQGLFGYTNGATIQNLNVEGTVSGSSNVGGVVGYSTGTVENCSFSGSVSGSDNYVGGVVGYNEAEGVTATVTNCYNTGTVTSTSYWVGGVVGRNRALSGGTATITNCYNTGTVTSSDNDNAFVGGVVGDNYCGTVENCYNTGTVNGTGYYVGGVAGRNSADSNGTATMIDCYNTGAVNGESEYVGGVVGSNEAYGYSDEIGTTTMTNCYNTGSVSGTTYVGGVVGANDVGYTGCTATVSNCVSLANTITGTSSVGRVAGSNKEGTLSGLYAWSGTTGGGDNKTTTGLDGADLYYNSSTGFSTADGTFSWSSMGWTEPSSSYQLPNLFGEIVQNPLVNLEFITITFSGTDTTVTMEIGGSLTASDIPTAPDGKIWDVDLTTVYYVGTTITAKDAVASVKIGDDTTSYGSIEDAIDAANTSGGTVTLLMDAETTATLTISGTVTIDLAGFDIKASGDGYNVITVSNSGNLTLTGTANSAITGGISVGGTFNLSGALTIDKIYLESDKVITLTGAYTGTAIPVTTSATPVDGTPVTITSGAGITTDGNNYVTTSSFSSTDYTISTTDGGEIELMVEHVHSWSYDFGKTENPAYTEDGDEPATIDDTTTIVATCTNKVTGVCDGDGGTIQIVKPTSLTYTGSAIVATLTNSLDSDITTPTIVYYEKVSGSYSTTAMEGSPINVGDYKATITLGETTAFVEYSITAASGSGTVSMADWTYGGTASTPVPTSSTNGTNSVTYKYTGTGDTNYTESTTAPTNAGTYTVTATFAASGNYAEVTATDTFTISTLDYNTSNFTISGVDSSYNYTGSEIKPEPKVEYGTTLTKDTDYTLSYSDNTAVGTGKVTITFKGNFSSSADVKFTIAYKTADDLSAIFKDYGTTSSTWDDSVTFSTNTGYTVSSTINGTFSDSITLNTASTTTSGTTATVYVKDSSGYIYPVTVTYRCDTTTPTATVSTAPTVSGTSLEYTVGNSNTTQVSGTTYSGTTTGITVDSSTGKVEITVAGTYTVTATSGAGLTSTTTITVYSVTFDTSNVQLVNDGDKVTIQTATAKTGYTFKQWEATSGTAFDFDTEIKQNYELTSAWTLDSPSVSVESTGNTTYGTNVTLTAEPSHNSNVTYSYQWYKGDDAVTNETSSTLTLTNVADSGSYTVKVTASDGTLTSGETESSATTVDITAATITITPKSSQSKYFGETDPTLTYTYTGNMSNETPAFTGALSRATEESIGTYTITIGTLALTDNGDFIANNYALKLSDTTVTFAISYATAASGSYTLPTANDAGWYNNGTISAGSGYKISTSDSGFGDSITLTDSADSSVTFYVKNTETGAVAQVTIDSYKLDSVTPTATSSTPIASGTELTYTVGNSSTTQVSGTTYSVSPTDGASIDGTTVTISKAGEYTITATSEAGLKDTETITVYSVTFDGGTAQLVNDSGKVTSQTATDRTGYTFKQWEATSGTAFDFDTEIKQSYTLTSAWTLDGATITQEAFTTTYNGVAQTISPSISHDLDDTVSYTYQWYKLGTSEYEEIESATSATYDVTNVSESGTYKLVVTAKVGNTYTSTAELAIIVTVNPLTITDSMIAMPTATYTYKGSAHKPLPTVSFASGDSTITLSEGTDYTLGYSDNTNAGTATVTVTAAAGGNYTDDTTKASGSFTIDKKEIAIEWGTIATYTYTGVAQLYPTASYTPNSSPISLAVTLPDDETFLNADEYTFTAGFDEADPNSKNYTLTGTDTQTVTMSPATLTVSVAETGITKTYDGDATVDGIDTDSLTVVGLQNNETATASGTWAYTSKDVATEIAVDVTDIAISYDGTASSSNYTYTQANLTTEGAITAYELTANWSDYTTSYTYNGVTQSYGITQTMTGVNSEEVVLSVAIAGTFQNAQDYTATATLPNTYTNYTLSDTGNTKTVTISPLEITDGMIAMPTATYTYTGSAQTSDPTISFTNGDGGTTTLAKGTDYALSYSSNTNAGTAKVTIFDVDGGNYTLATTIDKTFTIGQVTLTPSVNSVTGRAYNGLTATEGTISLSGAVNDEAPTATATFNFDTATAGTNKAVDVTAITLGDSWKTNYTLSTTSLDDATSTAEVTKVTLTPSIGTLTAKEYDGDTEFTSTITLSGAVTVDGTAEEPTANATAYNSDSANVVDVTKVTATGIALNDTWGTNYVLSATSAEKTQADLITAKVVTFTWYGESDSESDFSFVYDGTDKTVTAEVRNKVGEDSFALTYDDNVKAAKGDYTATVTALGNSNYTLTGVGDTVSQAWSVTAQPITFVVSNNSYTYDATAKTAAVTQTESETVKIAGDMFVVTYKLIGEEFSDGTTNKTDANTYDVMVEITDSNFMFEGGSTQKVVGTLTISPKSITAVWTGTTTVYTGSAQAPSVDFVGTVDDADVYTSMNSGTYAGSYTIELSGINTNYTVTNPTRSFTISKAPVTFTIAEGGSVSAKDVDGDTYSSEEYTVTYIDSKGNVSGVIPTSAGSYSVYVKLLSTNYRLSGLATSEGTIGTYTVGAKSYTATFGETEITSLAGAFVTIPAGTDVGDQQFVGWSYNNVTYKAGVLFTQPSSNVTFTAVYQAVYSIGGTVVQDNGDSEVENPALTNATVTLMSGSTQVGDTVVTDENGAYSFSSVPAGTYNIVVTYDGVTRTSVVTISDGDVTIDTITMPKGITNSIVEVAAGTPDVVVGGLDTLFDDTTADNTTANDYTSEDKKVVDDGGSVEIKLTVEENTATVSESSKTLIEEATSNVGTYLDISLAKTVDDGKTDPTTTAVTETSQLLKIIVPLSGDLQGKASYTVYRVHDGELHTISTTENEYGEYLEVNDEKTQITLLVKYFSDYALAYTEYSSGSPNVGTLIDPDASSTTTETTTTTDDDFPFVDVDDDSYYYDAVAWAEENGITSGKSSTIFAPEDVNTRAEAVTFLWRAMDSPESSGDTQFADLEEDSYYYEAVLWAVENGITIGTSDTTFSPYDTCSRAHIVTFLWRMVGELDADTDNIFDDVSGDDYYFDAVLWAVMEEITKGTSDDAFSPDDNCTRAQIVTFLYRYFGL